MRWPTASSMPLTEKVVEDVAKQMNCRRSKLSYMPKEMPSYVYNNKYILYLHIVYGFLYCIFSVKFQCFINFQSRVCRVCCVNMVHCKVDQLQHRFNIETTLIMSIYVLILMFQCWYINVDATFICNQYSTLFQRWHHDVESTLTYQRWCNFHIQPIFNIVSTLKPNVVSTLKPNVVSTLTYQRGCNFHMHPSFNVSSTLILNVDTQRCINVESTLFARWYEVPVVHDCVSRGYWRANGFVV